MIALLQILGILGLIFLGLTGINTVTGTFFNISSGKEKFSWRKLGKGLLKSTLFYVCSCLVAVLFNLIPIANSMIIAAYGITLISQEVLKVLSVTSILGAIVAVCIQQGKKAIEGIGKLGQIKAVIAEEKVTWAVIDPETETEDGE
jgi:hypothetical protein